METALDCYTRFLRTYGSVVRGITEGEFLSAYSAIKNKAKALTEEYSEEAVLFDAVEAYKKIIFSKTGRPVPEDPYEQLEEAAGANLSRWESEETQVYRELHEIPGDIYTAAVIQAMVYGNIDENSCTGTVFTRDPSTGERTACGEFLVKAQGGGQDVQRHDGCQDRENQRLFPQLYDRFVMIANLLERYNQDMQEIEFTIQQGRLLCSRPRADGDAVGGRKK